jgi:hypothetical protein
LNLFNNSACVAGGPRLDARRRAHIMVGIRPMHGWIDPRAPRAVGAPMQWR